MNRLRLAVAVKEKEYIRRLADYVRGGPFRERCQLTAFTHAEACLQYVKQGFAIDLIAAEPQLLPELKEALPHIPTVALVGSRGESGHDREVLRFQALPQLMGSLLEQHAPGPQGGEKGRHGDGSGAAIVAVHSASGGVGKTALALHLAHSAGAAGLKACYLNLERWNTAEAWLSGAPSREGEQVAGMSELLYALKAHGSVPPDLLAACRQHEPRLNGDCVPGFNHPGDRESLTAEEALSLVESVAGSGFYDVVIVDLDHGLSELQLSVLERSRHVLSVVTDDRSAMGKLALSHRYGVHQWGERFERLLRRTLLVRNRAIASGDGALQAFGLPAALAALPDVPEWRQGGDVRLLGSPAFRAAAAELLRLVLKAGVSSHAS